MANHGGGHHVVPFKALRNVCIALIVLTILTVFTAKGIHLGHFGPIVAFAIAATKAFLVMGVFMGLKWDDKSNRLIFSTGFIFLGILFFFCALDIWTRVLEINTL